MKVSYNWLRSYIESLPRPEQLVDMLNTHAFEVESMEEHDADTVIDVDVLPNRSHDCLSHRGIAREIATLYDCPIQETVQTYTESDTALGFRVDIEGADFCTRFVGCRIENIDNTVATPSWMTERLQVLGQRTINPLVDITNYVMLDIGKPMHVFDADKVRGHLSVRRARTGEYITTLDGKDIALHESVYVIADEEGPLAIAGIKGGKRAEVTKDTKHILIESALFDAPTIRKTSREIGIRTDSSKRFENGISAHLAYDGYIHTVAHIMSCVATDTTRIGKRVDIYSQPEAVVQVEVHTERVTAILGASISSADIEDIFRRCKFAVHTEGDVYHVTIPSERLDLRIEEDIIEEIGRIYGYERIVPSPITTMAHTPHSSKEYAVIERIKNVLVRADFSEVYTYMFGTEGDKEVLSPAASDKNFIRSSLLPRLQESLGHNAKYADLLGVSSIAIFEIGKVIRHEGERLMLGLGIKHVRKQKTTEVEEMKQMCDHIFSELGLLPDPEIVVENSVIEIPLENYIAQMPDQTETMMREIISHADDTTTIQAISVYPFVLRDIALWVPDQESETIVYDLLQKEAGDLLVRLSLFDVYKKDGRTSYAFNLVFQSDTRTLTDEEVHTCMEHLYAICTAKGWEVR